MRRIATAVCALTLSLLLVAPTSSAQTPGSYDPQDLEDLDNLSRALQVVGTEYANRYVQPVSDALGSGLNAGLFRTAEVGGGIFPLVDIYVGVSVSGALMAHSDKVFPTDFQETLSGPGGQQLTLRFQNPQGTAPTAFGNTEPPANQLIIEDEQGNEVSTTLPPGLVDTPVAPLVIPQVGIGSLFGTDVQLRYLPETRLYKYGTVGLFGVAVRHSLSQYIPLSPLSLSVQGAWNRASMNTRSFNTSGSLSFDEVIDASGWAFNVQASKSLPVLPVTFYGGLQYETFDVAYTYAFDPDQSGSFNPITLEVDQDASNRFRGLAGVSLTLAVVRVNIDYALSANDAVTFGLGFKL